MTSVFDRPMCSRSYNIYRSELKRNSIELSTICILQSAIIPFFTLDQKDTREFHESASHPQFPERCHFHREKTAMFAWILLCISNWIVAKSMCSVCANKTKMRYDHEIKCVYSVPMAAMLYARSVGFPSIEQTCSIRCVCVCQGGSAKTTPAENCIRKGHAMLRRIQFERRLAATTIAIKPRYERKI